VLVSGGLPYCWGGGESCGDNNTSNLLVRYTPVPVFFWPAVPTKTTSISAGSNHACTVIDARIYCWGNLGAVRAGLRPGMDSIAAVPIPVPIVE
jgi:hypothetical protein